MDTVALQADAARLADEISHLTYAWDAAAEVDTNLGNDVERAGQRLSQLLGRTATAIAGSDPLRAAQLHRVLADLYGAVDFYAGLDEHEADASIDIFERLGPGIALVLRVIQVQEDPEAGDRVTASELIERLRRLPPHREVWIATPAGPQELQPLAGQTYLRDGTDPRSGEPRQVIVLS